MNSAAHSFGLFPIRIFTKVDAYLDFASDDTGDTALHTSMARQNMSGAVELICAGADETKKNKDGKTPYDMVDEKFGKHVRGLIFFRFHNLDNSGYQLFVIINFFFRTREN